MLFLCSQRRDMEPPLIVQTESEEVLQEQQLRQRQKRRLSSTPVSQIAGRLVLMLLLWQYFSISQGLCTYEETSFLFVLPFTPFSFLQSSPVIANCIFCTGFDIWSIYFLHWTSQIGVRVAIFNHVQSPSPCSLFPPFSPPPRSRI